MSAQSKMIKLPSIFHLGDLVGLNAPEFPADQIWLNSPELKIRDLRKSKKLVLIDFWTYSCVNCLRTLPYLKHWHEKYASLGLVIIGVHTPEFDFEKAPHNVSEFLVKQDIKYPVVLDSGYKIWNAYANQYWPRKILIDSKGKIRYDHAGEGNYAETEAKIQELLTESNPSLKFGRVVSDLEHLGPGNACYPVTPETYCGWKRGILGNEGGYLKNRVLGYHAQTPFEDGKIYLQGPWLAVEESLNYQPQKGTGDFLALAFHGLEVNAVMGSQVAQKVVLSLDGKVVPKEMAGSDVRYVSGQSVVLIDGPRMYNIVKTNFFASHMLKLSPTEGDFRIYAFTFGGCSH